MARNGALLFGALALGTLFLKRDSGLARLLTRPNAAGVMARQMLATTLVAAFVLGWGAIRAVRGTQASVEFAIAALVVGGIIVTSALVILTAAALDRMAAVQRRERLALDESAARLEHATSAAELGIWTWEPDTDTVFLSEHARRIVGLTGPKSEISFAELFAHVHPDDAPRIRDKDGIKLSTGDYRNEYRVRGDDGALRWVAVRGVMVFFGDMIRDSSR